jgi:hypothetical protein
MKKVDWADCSREAKERTERDANLIQKEPIEDSNAIAV